LKPGDYSEPISTPWGYHIVLRESLGEADALDVLKKEYIDRRRQEAEELAQKDAKVEWIAARRPD
jgi:parvulin-like peptidyl-prolyl isomerase